MFYGLISKVKKSNSATCTVHTYRELKLRYSLTPWCIQITLNTNSRTQNTDKYKSNINIYISGVKISALTREIIFFQIKALKIFNAINAGAGLGLATSFTTAASVSFFLKRIVFI